MSRVQNVAHVARVLSLVTEEELARIRAASVRDVSGKVEDLEWLIHVGHIEKGKVQVFSCADLAAGSC